MWKLVVFEFPYGTLDIIHCSFHIFIDKMWQILIYVYKNFFYLGY